MTSSLGQIASLASVPSTEVVAPTKSRPTGRPKKRNGTWQSMQVTVTSAAKPPVSSSRFTVTFASKFSCTHIMHLRFLYPVPSTGLWFLAVLDILMELQTKVLDDVHVGQVGKYCQVCFAVTLTTIMPDYKCRQMTPIVGDVMTATAFNQAR